MLIGALLVQMQAGRYSAAKAISSSFVHDIILDNVPVVNVDYIIVQGAVAMFLLALVLGALRPQYLLFGLKVTALLVLVRAGFINLTNLGLNPNELILGATASASFRLYRLVDYPGNYFFSGHTAVPFLLALVFWRARFWRMFFFLASALFGASVLLAHIHYSIDVFAAPFIAYGMFRIAALIFPEDYALAAHPQGSD
ncbi:MAG TPA: phosphatase PAP2-related protein [Candidatus Paceibacterota bacterium]|nr:phosphatase PAP2-related protein [Candidatus Paceibacterota bacterium]